MINAIVVGHHALPQALEETLKSIVGSVDGMIFISNQGLSSDRLARQINEALDQLNPDQTIIFVDVPGGSCAISCMNILKYRPKLRIIAGVNLLMLLEFYINRSRHPLDKLAELLIAKGKESIRPLDHEHHA